MLEVNKRGESIKPTATSQGRAAEERSNEPGKCYMQRNRA